ncbi:MAG: hypothetical protein HUU20_15330, partial [Pirellulales bacterium]|nr:hypothetical protein [Pirellulales bacterium]
MSEQIRREMLVSVPMVDKFAFAIGQNDQINPGAASAGLISAADYVPARVSAVANRVTPRQSEIDAGRWYGLRGNQAASFRNGQPAAPNSRGSTRPEYFERGNSFEVKNFDLTTRAGRANLVRKTVEQALSSRLPNLPRGTVQNIIIDARGQTLDPQVMRQIAQDLQIRSGGVIQARNVQFMQGARASSLATGARALGRVAAVGGAAYDTYRIATSENKFRTGSGVIGGWTGAWAVGK